MTWPAGVAGGNGYVLKSTTGGVLSWEEADKYVVYAQEHNLIILASIWPHANWEQKSCKRKKARSPFGKKFTKYLSKPCSMDDYKTFLLKLIDRYDGDGSNDMPGLTKPIKYWDIMNEPCLLYTSPSPRDATLSRMPSAA